MSKRTEQMEPMEMEQEQSDAELIEAYLGGDPDSFRTLYDRYKRQLYAYLNRLCGQSANADDVFQQTWIRAVRSLPSYRNKELFLAWLMRIAHNLTVDSFRAKERRAEQSLSEVDPETDEAMMRSGDTPSGNAERKELSAAIERAVQKLSPELREVFLMRQDGVPFQEIAKIQGCSVNTSLARMRYALNNLRVHLKDWYAETNG